MKVWMLKKILHTNSVDLTNKNKLTLTLNFF